MGFNPLPFLAGAGILGVVVGFGAQSLIDDIVSGFFILFENTYLVGDTIEVGAAKGVVEAIEFRTTKIRDGDGRVHIIRAVAAALRLHINDLFDEQRSGARRTLIPRE